MAKRKTTGERPEQHEEKIPEAGGIREERFRFGEASVRVREVDVNTWQCSLDGTAVSYTHLTLPTIYSV